MKDETIVIPQRDEVRVYANQGGSITIEQVDPFDSDPIRVTIHPSDVAALCKALRAQRDAIKSGGID